MNPVDRAMLHFGSQDVPEPQRPIAQRFAELARELRDHYGIDDDELAHALRKLAEARSAALALGRLAGIPR